MHIRVLWLAVIFVLLTGCGGGLSSELNEYAEHCKQESQFGTNGCINLRDKINIEFLQEMKKRVEEHRDYTVQQLGEQGYETSLSILDDDIARVEADRPGFFSRMLKGVHRGDLVMDPYHVADMDNTEGGLVDMKAHWVGVLIRVRQKLGDAYAAPGLPGANGLPVPPRPGPSPPNMVTMTVKADMGSNPAANAPSQASPGNMGVTPSTPTSSAARSDTDELPANDGLDQDEAGAGSSLDERFQRQAEQDCAGQNDTVCRDKLLNTMCEGHWSATPASGQTVCKTNAGGQ